MSPPIPRLQDHVRVGPVLGRGGFGVVRRGELREGGLPVAVKLPARPQDADARRRVLREGRLVEGVVHPNLARLHGVFEDGAGGLALVYELVPGESLDQVLAARTPERDELADWIRDIGAGLQALHRAGLVHRDLKPGNLMLRPDGRIVVLDFGLARCERQGETVTETGVVLGTPSYMAPEQLSGERVGPACDVYALACVVHHVLEGRPPFTGTAAEVLRGHLNLSPPRLATGGVGRGPSMHAALAGALAKTPEARPALGELLVALEEALREEGPPGASREGPTRVHRVPLARPHEPSTRRRSRVRRLATPVLPVLALAFAFGAMLPASDPARAPATPETAGAPDAAAPAPPLVGGLADLAATFRRELTEAAGWRRGSDGALYRTEDPPDGVSSVPALDEDPLNAGLLLAEFRSLEGYRRWLREGGRPEDLPEARLRELAEVEAAAEAEGLAPPFGSLLRLRPAPGRRPGPPPAAFPGLQFPPTDLDLEGWGATFVRELSEGFLLREHLEAELRAAAPEDAPGGLVSAGMARATMMARRIPADYARFFSYQPQLRARLRGWLAPLAEKVRGAFYAAMRAAREEPHQAARVAWLVDEYLGFLKAGGFGHLSGLPDELVLGRAPRTPEEWMILANLHAMRIKVYGGMGQTERRRAAEDRALAAFRRVEAIEGDAGAVPVLRGSALLGQLGILEDRGEHEAMARLVDALRSMGGRVDRMRIHSFLKELLRYWQRNRRGQRLGPARLRWVAAEYRRTLLPEAEKEDVEEVLQELLVELG